MTDFNRLYITKFNPALCPLFSPFLLCLAAMMVRLLDSSRSSPSWSFFRPLSNSLSFAPSLPPIPVVFKNFSISATPFSSPSRFANHLPPTWGCHMMPSFSSSRTSFLLCFLHFRHRAYKCSSVCSVAPHHQHLEVLIMPILAKNVPTAPCPTLSW